jgi:hypothetical protein
MKLLDKIKLDPNYNQYNSQKWFIQKIYELTGKKQFGSLTYLGDHLRRQHSFVTIGEMYHFVYSPKHKDTLPLYDKFPLVFPFSILQDGFIGLNIHYMVPNYRIYMIDQLKEIGGYGYGKDRDPKKLRLSWSLLSSSSKVPGIDVSVKRYLYSHVKSRFAKIPPREWIFTAQLPTENWAKGRPW